MIIEIIVFSRLLFERINKLCDSKCEEYPKFQMIYFLAVTCDIQDEPRSTSDTSSDGLNPDGTFNFHLAKFLYAIRQLRSGGEKSRVFQLTRDG